MSYDEKTSTIKIKEGATEDDLLRDTFAHFAHVERQIAKDFPEKFNQSKPATKNGSRRLTKPVRAGIVAMVSWVIFVIYRTSDSHELLGIYLERWNSDSFLINLIVVPCIMIALIYAGRWIMREQKPATQIAAPSKNPLNDFQKEIETWNPNDAKLALLLIKATLIGDQKSIDRISDALTVEQFLKVVAVVKAMRGEK